MSWEGDGQALLGLHRGAVGGQGGEGGGGLLEQQLFIFVDGAHLGRDSSIFWSSWHWCRNACSCSR